MPISYRPRRYKRMFQYPELRSTLQRPNWAYCVGIAWSEQLSVTASGKWPKWMKTKGVIRLNSKLCISREVYLRDRIPRRPKVPSAYGVNRRETYYPRSARTSLIESAAVHLPIQSRPEYPWSKRPVHLPKREHSWSKTPSS